MSAKGRIAKLNQIKDLVRNFSKGTYCMYVWFGIRLICICLKKKTEVERVEKYANERLGVSKLLKSMREIQRMQDSLYSNNSSTS
jgi:hypothetical protein